MKHANSGLVRGMATVFAAVLTLGAWGQAPPTRQEVTNLLKTVAPGWQVTQAPKLYDEDSLWEWIDGEAPEVLAYRFSFAGSALHTSGDLRVEVGVFVTEDPLDAFGLLSHQSTEGSKPAPIENASFWEGSQLHVWRNYAYVRFLPSSQDVQARTPVRELADKLLEKLPAAEKIPPMLGLLPKNNQVPASLAFVRSNVLGDGRLSNGVSADYRAGGAVMKAWVLDCGSKDGARQALAVMAEILGKTRSISALGDEAFAGASNLYGPTIAMREQNYAACVLKALPPDFAEALLRMLTVRIRISEAQGD